MKLDLETLSAPVTWIGPGGKGDEVWADDEPGFLDLVVVLLGGGTGFLDAFKLEALEDFLPFGEILVGLAAGVFLFRLTGVVVDSG